MSKSLYLSGTEIEEKPKRLLRAGALEASFDDGALRWIHWNGTEILRGILFLVRTPGWDTPQPVISNLSIQEDAARFHIHYDSHYGDPGHGVVVRVALEGRSDGTLSAQADIRAEVPFSTNRTGFVVLHPLAGFAGTGVRVEQAHDSAVRDVSIPLEISPGQPLFDIRAITHQPRPGLSVSTRFAGDVFEMEDQRNWSDASFKTYNRPIGLPYPYELNPTEPVSQSVLVTVVDLGATDDVVDPVPVPVRDQRILPAFALPLDRLSNVAEAMRFSTRIAAIKPQLILLRYDPSRGDDLAQIDSLALLLGATGAALALDIVLSGEDAPAARGLVQQLADALSAVDIQPVQVSAFAKVDEQSFQPGEVRPPHLSEAQLANLLSAVFPHARHGGGTPAFFTEFNRKRPEPGYWDYLSFSTVPIVHAADDASVIETLQSLPHVLHSATRLARGKPLAIGPVGIGARLNPYGPAPTVNEPQHRDGMAARDPRHRGLLAAAWHVGYLARISAWNVERFAFGAPTGPFGLVSSHQAYPRPVWDAWPEGAAFPLYHVARWIAAAAGARLLEATIEGSLAQLHWHKDGRRQALIANLGTLPIVVELAPFANPHGQLLDETHVEQAALRMESFAQAQPLTSHVTLTAYAVLHVEEGEPV